LGTQAALRKALAIDDMVYDQVSSPVWRHRREILGAGAGGYLLLFCPFYRKHNIAREMDRAGALPVDFAFDERGLQTWTACTCECPVCVHSSWPAVSAWASCPSADCAQ
jgi:hypothetical protein